MAPTLEILEQTLADVKQIDPAKGRSIMTDYDDFINEFQLTVRAKSLMFTFGKGQAILFQ